MLDGRETFLSGRGTFIDIGLEASLMGGELSLPPKMDIKKKLGNNIQNKQSSIDIIGKNMNY